METSINMEAAQRSAFATDLLEKQSKIVSRQKQPWRTLLLGIGIGLGVALVLVFFNDVSSFIRGSSGVPDDFGGLEAGVIAPNFTATDLEGNSVQLSDYLGQPVMLTFWSPDCTACVEEIPILQAIANDSTIDIAMVTVTGGVSVDTVRDFVQEHAITFPVLLDEYDEASASYKTQYVPFSYFINADGTIAENMSPARAYGEALREELITWLQKCKNNVGCQQK